ncbi:leukocyte immunoglobulin-like receptor subfamily A member 6 [Gracilinanus agilis]|uniref:leukocyte immunoglobulin-like receptor subfamily A member 6 n=1 Tax=Gracilinanus agilis TaxID=191870 RepID=UPI001CFCBE88|nr:leukocyte immunoglobulin-like receptor subfamily A member 6 [Gracilinanus agilis]
MTLRCRGSQEADLYRLEQKLGNARSDVKDMTVFGMEAKFSFPFVSWNHAGTYYCHYRHSLGWSEPSDPLELVVTEVYKEPSLAALPSSEVASGQYVILQCQSQRWFDWCALYKDGEEISRGRTRSHEGGRQADFFFPVVNSTHDGTYRCYSFRSSSPNAWSSPSAPLVLRVTGTSSPSPESENRLSHVAVLDYTMGNLVRLISAGLIIILLVVLLAEHWKSSRESLSEHSGQTSPQDSELKKAVPEQQKPMMKKGLYTPPSLAALPSSEVAPGQNVTLQCGSE